MRDPSDAAPIRDELVLVGGGHAHVQLIRRWAMQALPGVRLTLVLDRPEAVYSGMLPGFAAGEISERELEIDVVPLARRAGARVILAAATGLDPLAKRIALAGRAPIAYDVASLNVGSGVRGLALPGAREHALATRPIRAFVDGLDAALARLRERGRDAPTRVAMLGAGAAGFELALTLEARLRALGLSPEVLLLDDASEILPGASRAMVRKARAECAARGVRVRTNAAAVAFEAGRVVLRDGAEPCDLAILATGAAPTPLLAGVALAKDAGGFLRVRATLQSVDSDDVFAVGDCAALEHAAWVPKAGVYAVREGRILDANLRARLRGGALADYRPQRDFLSLLNLGEGRALGGKWGVAVSGRSVHRLKSAIDRRFLQRFQVLANGRSRAALPPREAMSCGGCAAKLSAGGLARALARIGPPLADPAVLIGLGAPDDVAALRTRGGDVLLASIDGFRAFTDDPWLVGSVAAVNALSDLYASGGLPRHALAWVSVPEGAGAEETLYQVMAGVRSELDPRGVALVGGHTTTGPELVVGLAVNGELPEGAATLTKGGLRAGDALLLTKPLGTGIVLAADMQGLARGAWTLAAHASMLRANDVAAGIARSMDASACTDVSGFGLAVHLGEMLRASGVGALLTASAIPALPGAAELIASGIRSSFHAQNEEAACELLGAETAPALRALLCDPQTSGGLLIGVGADRAGPALAQLRAAGVDAAKIGAALAGPPRIALC